VNKGIIASIKIAVNSYTVVTAILIMAKKEKVRLPEERDSINLDRTISDGGANARTDQPGQIDQTYI
jgi:hypothetical protein